MECTNNGVLTQVKPLSRVSGNAAFGTRQV